MCTCSLFTLLLGNFLFNDTPWKNLIEYKNSLKHQLGCFWRFPYVYTINKVLLILLSYRCLKNVIHQVNSKNEWLLLSVTFTAKLDLVFVLTFENGTRDFQNSSPFERSACFYVTICESFELFQYFNFETNFLENENLFPKTGVPLFSWNH